MLIGNAENLMAFAEIGDLDDGVPIPLRPMSRHREGHVFHIIVREEHALQVVEDDLARLDVSHTFVLSLPLGVAMWITTRAF